MGLKLSGWWVVSHECEMGWFSFRSWMIKESHGIYIFSENTTSKRGILITFDLFRREGGSLLYSEHTKHTSAPLFLILTWNIGSVYKQCLYRHLAETAMSR